MTATGTGLRLEPFRATAYADRSSTHLRAVSSPAYDLIPPDQRQNLQDADPHNIVRLILPLDEPGMQDKYACAGESLTDWLHSGVLEAFQTPALFVYEMSDPRDDGTLIPTFGVLGQIPVLPVGDPGVLPHEGVWPPVVEDRTRLAEATAANLEPIVLAVDLLAEEWPDVLAVRRTRPTLDFVSPDDIRHRIWPVTDTEVIDRIAGAVSGGQAVIADGHHRWASYQRLLERSADPGARHALVFLVPVGGAGLHVRAIHRRVSDLALSDALASARSAYTIRDVTGQLTEPGVELAAQNAQQLLARSAPGTVILSDGVRWYEATDPDPAAVRAAVGTDHGPAWRQLDVSVAHRYLLQTVFGRPEDDEAVQAAYDAAVTATKLRVGSETGVLVLLRSATPADVLAVARAGDRMPRKSTLFVPKPRTGLLLRRFADQG